jgi:hypothetical protein
MYTLGFGQNQQSFQHPGTNLRVQAFEDWVQVPHPENDTIYEIADPESVLRVMMWRTESESEGSDFLKKMAEKKNLVYDADPQIGNIDNRDAWILDATCCMKEAPVRVVLIAIPDKKEGNALYMAQVLCPETRLKEKGDSMEDIIYSLQITD